MDTDRHIIKNTAIALLLPSAAFSASILIQYALLASATIPAVFVLAVFLVSMLTDGYIYGIAATVASVFAVNFAFTFPYFSFNFTIPENAVSAVIMLVVSLATCTMTAEVKRQDSIKAESEKERMKANLLRAVSHDLRTPLTSIYGATTAMLENGESFTAEQKQKMLGSIREDSEWLMRMVENLLSITRLDGGRVRLIKTPTVLDELIDSVLVKFKKRYPEQEVLLDLPEEFTVIPMDAILIEQVLENILGNAMQHAKGMTELRLRVFTMAQKAIFEISDNGCGIAEAKMKELFTGSGSGEAPSDGRKSNAGIGLSVCATIIRAHSGELKAQNLKSGGAVFRFTLDMEGESDA